MPYTASRPSLFGAVGGVQPPTGAQVDVPGAIDAFTRGATSLIHGAVLRRQAEQSLAMEQAKLDMERDRESRERTSSDRDYELKRQKQKHDFLIAGGVPEHDEIDAVPAGQAQIAQLNTPIRRAVVRGGSSLPVAGVTPSAGAPEGPVTAPPVGINAVEGTHVPETYDPTRAASYIRATTVAGLHEQGLVTRTEVAAEERAKLQRHADEERMARTNELNASRERIAELNRQARANGIRRGMTGDALHKAKVEEAKSLLMSRFGGNQGAFEDYIRDDADGRAWAAEIGKAGVGDAVSIVREAHSSYITTRNKNMQAKLNNPNTSAPTAIAKTRAGETAAGVGAQPNRRLSTSTESAPDESALSDADLWEQKVKGGMTKDAATEYVNKRKKKKP